MLAIVDQSSTRPPAQPAYIFRGHTSQIHALLFARGNSRLVTGDADGWLVLWNLPLRRPAAVWRAHSSTILGLCEWQDNLISHGRDGKLCVWQLKDEDEATFSKVLPVDDQETARKQPWLLHSMLVHALNFCSFTSCVAPSTDTTDTAEILIAISGVEDGSIVLLTLPGEQRITIIPTLKENKTGMLMATGLQPRKGDKLPLVFAGYESGHVAIWHQVEGIWQSVYVNKAHSQPIMSLAVAHSLESFYTSSADAIIASHSFSRQEYHTETTQTKHAGQQSLQVRSDERLVAAAGWDARIRVYSAKTLKELAVLKWHKEGCYAVAFASVPDNKSVETSVAKATTTVAQRRLEATKATHWLAAGSKDGKISLWDIY